MTSKRFYPSNLNCKMGFVERLRCSLLEYRTCAIVPAIKNNKLDPVNSFRVFQFFILLIHINIRVQKRYFKYVASDYFYSSDLFEQKL